MLNFSFIATLFCLLHCFIATVSVEPLLMNPSFLSFDKTLPCVWHDGSVSLNEGKVSISVGRKSSCLVSSKKENQAPLVKVETINELIEPDSFIFIATERDEVHSTYEKRNYFITRIATQFLSGGGNELYKSFENSLFDVAILRTSPSDPVTEVDEVETFMNTENISNSAFSKLLDPENDSILTSENTAPFDNHSGRENNLVDLFNTYITRFKYFVAMNNLIKDSEETTEQGALINDVITTDVQNQVSVIDIKGAQVKSKKYIEPMICITKNRAKTPLFASSLTGAILRQRNKILKPFTGKNRIPDDTKLLMVKVGDSMKYYKNITGESKVWHLRRDEKVFYPCIVHRFSRAKERPTLRCIGHEPMTVPEVSWDDIFPIESTEMIKDLGEFKIERKDINWDDISSQKKTDTTRRDEPKASKSLPRKRKNTTKEKATQKEQRINEEVGVNNLPGDPLENLGSFRVGDQLSHKKDIYSPLIFIAFASGDKVIVLDSLVGQLRKFDQNNVKLAASPPIPKETKISEDGKYKIILPKSDVLYRHSDGTYYPCIVTLFSYQSPIKINCSTHGVLAPSWNEILPIEALPTLTKPFKIHGFEDTEIVTLDMLRNKIDTLL